MAINHPMMVEAEVVVHQEVIVEEEVVVHLGARVVVEFEVVMVMVEVVIGPQRMPQLA